MHGYVERLSAAFPCIREVWLFGSRANGGAGPNSDWDYLVFTDDGGLLNRLHLDPTFRHADVDLFVCADGRIAAAPWCPQGEQQKQLLLDNEFGCLNWQCVSDDEAEYTETKEASPGDVNSIVRKRRAIRVYLRKP